MTETSGPQSEILSAHRADLEAFAAQMLQDYMSRIQAERSRSVIAPKEVNDSLWGTLRLRPSEVLVLDSPLVQRLRRIRQLGVVHLVYPAAVHTRLEHSLGVMYQVQRLCDSINLHTPYGPADATPIPGAFISMLRLAALCHDIGHGVMSHVSENALANDDSCRDLRYAFANTHGQESKQLSEIAAYYMIGSPAFLELLSVIDVLVPGELQELEAGAPGTRLQRIQCALQSVVIGESVSDRVPLLHELISGPFDADKLDYMPRDAATCGVPVVTDVPRLIQKVRAVSLGEGELPKPVKRLVKQSQPQYYLTGIARSGARTLDELALGRALMFDKVYRHQKVRAAEAMVASIIVELLAIDPSRPATLPLRVADEELLGLTARSAATLVGKELGRLGARGRRHAYVAADIAARLRARRVLARGFAFSPKMYGDPYRNEPAQRVGLHAMSTECRNPRTRLAVVERVVEEMRALATLLDDPSPDACVPGNDLIPYIWIDPPQVVDAEVVEDTGHAYLIGSREDVRRSDEEYAETLGWSEAYVSTRDLGLVFCPVEVSELLYLAFERVVREIYQVRIPRTMLAYAKIDAASLENLRRRAFDAGYYSDASNDLWPTPPVLLRPSTTDEIDGIVDRLKEYQGPIAFDPSTGKARAANMRRERIRSWLQQFGNETLVEDALRMLRAVRMIGRGEANAAISEFLNDNPGFQGASICVLGSVKDSSSVLTYYAADAARDFGCRLTSLPDALASGRPIVFLDDYVGTGRQAISIFEAWLGVEQSFDLHEERGEPLGPPMRDALRAAPIGLVFVAGTTEGSESLRNRLGELGLTVVVATHWTERDVPRLDESVVPDPTRLSALRAALVKIAKDVLADGVPGHDQAWIEERVLGYGNRGLLLVSAYNTPTASITALWKGSPDLGGWEALFPRRPKE